MGNEEFLFLWKTSIVILDESDWILFDGAQVEKLANNISFFKQAAKVIGLTGSKLNCKELSCLKTAFETSPLVFPTLT